VLTISCRYSCNLKTKQRTSNHGKHIQLGIGQTTIDSCWSIWQQMGSVPCWNLAVPAGARVASSSLSWTLWWNDLRLEKAVITFTVEANPSNNAPGDLCFYSRGGSAWVKKRTQRKMLSFVAVNFTRSYQTQLSSRVCRNRKRCGLLISKQLQNVNDPAMVLVQWSPKLIYILLIIVKHYKETICRIRRRHHFYR